MRKYFYPFLCFLFLLDLQAQDQLFSQFYSAANFSNPALTGAFEGKFRVSSIYRDQWRKALDVTLTKLLRVLSTCVGGWAKSGQES